MSIYRRTPGLIATLVALTLLLGGCSVTTSRPSGTGDPRSIVHDNALTLDFTRRPTRADVGFAADQNFRAYDRTGPMLEATLKFPAGVITVPAMSVSAGTTSDDAATDKNYEHQPKYFQISRNFASAAEARATFLAQAGTLGLAKAEIDDTLPEVGAGTTAAQSRVLHGTDDSWLTVEIDLFDGDEPGQVYADYVISIDTFHNPAVDRVMHDGVFTADLTRRPSRADLGMLDGYGNADVLPGRGQKLAIRWKLPTGTLSEPALAIMVDSGKDGQEDHVGANEPRIAVVQLKSKDYADGKAQLRRDAPLLGLDEDEVATAFAGEPDEPRVEKKLTGAATEHYTVTAKLDIGRSADTPGTADIVYTFTFR